MSQQELRKLKQTIRSLNNQKHMSDAAKAIQKENALIERNVNAWLFRLDIRLNNT